MHIGAVIIHNRQPLLALVFGATFGHINHAAVKIAAFAGDPGIDRIGHFMRHPPPSAGGANKLQPIAKLFARKHVKHAEFHHNLIAADLHRPRDQRLRIDRLPVVIRHWRVKAGDIADIGIRGHFAKQPRARQIRRHHARDVLRKLARSAFINEIGHRIGHWFNFTIGKADGQFGLRWHHHGGKTAKAHKHSGG